jgi:hypothetical protein
MLERIDTLGMLGLERGEQLACLARLVEHKEHS